MICLVLCSCMCLVSELMISGWCVCLRMSRCLLGYLCFNCFDWVSVVSEFVVYFLGLFKDLCVMMMLFGVLDWSGRVLRYFCALCSSIEWVQFIVV